MHTFIFEKVDTLFDGSWAAQGLPCQEHPSPHPLQLISVSYLDDAF